MGIYEKMNRLDELRGRLTMAIVLAGIGITMFFISMGFGPSTPGMMLGLLIGLLGIPFGLGTTKKYKELYKEIFVEEPLRQNFENVLYAWKNGFNEATVRNFRLFNMGNIFKSEDYLRARYKGINFELSDVTVMRNQGKSTYTIFRGRIIVFDLPNKFIAPMRVYSKRFPSKSRNFKNGSEKIEMESVEFNKLFDVYSLSGHDTFYLLTPQMMEGLTKLQNMYPAIVAGFEGNKVLFAIHEAFNDAFDNVNKTQKLDYFTEIARTQKDIDDIKNIIDIVDQMDMQETVGMNGNMVNNGMNYSGMNNGMSNGMNNGMNYGSINNNMNNTNQYYTSL